MAKVHIYELIDKFQLELVSGEEGIHRTIRTSDISRPGLEMAGYFTYYPAERLQLLGKTELTFTSEMDEETRMERFEQLCTDETPGIIISRDIEVPKELLKASHKSGVPIMRSKVTTTRLSSRITNFLESRLAPTTAKHGVLVDIYGIGVLITGNSGVW